ncbi:hypothetical protein QTI17_31210 [Variovorax sp. J31P179]|uniref:hypothetical protein n=1 Tax=Variovorax sp. J31P179 TaxID=3053508 RepID=UPI002576CA73|nr:hypothetical protein [Variovorax sp. J31P179]MDM0085066.1 hypothetical protein [Variovorax sp. J31P179]
MPRNAALLAAHNAEQLRPGELDQIASTLRRLFGISNAEASHRQLNAAYTILEMMPSDTLAILWDEDPVLNVLADSIRINGRLKWRYATRERIIKNGKVLAARETDASFKIRDLNPPMKEVNRVLESGILQKSYPALSRLQRYAEIAALLRFVKAHPDLHLDLSDLIQVASFSDRTPTPDEILRPTPTESKKCPT